MASIKDKPGKPSKIRDYCETLSHNHKCIWVCKQHGDRKYAIDETVGDGNSFNYISRQSLWNRYFSFYPASEPRLVKILFLDGKRHPKLGFEVVAKAVDHEQELDDCQNELERLRFLKDDLEPGCCSVDVDGKRHESGFIGCDNLVWDKACEDEISVPIEMAKQRLRFQSLEWMPEMLGYYWRNGFHENADTHFRRAGLLYHTRTLAYDNFIDAESEFGRELYAIELLRSWQFKRIILCALGCLFVDVIVFVVLVLVRYSLDTAFAAGSYAAGVEAVAIAVLAMVSGLLASRV